ncbi:MAG: hypothetical protein SF123_24400 [Chloroflexota bacterium]|nr:hypothetical protein [Chloroflexota bacterium]
MNAIRDLNWQPVILLKVVRMPFGAMCGLSLTRAYIALHGERLLYADWTLEAAERAEPLVCPTGWTLESLPELPVQLVGTGAKLIPTGTWLLHYSDRLFTLYSAANDAVTRLIRRIDQYPTDPRTLAALERLVRLV